MVDKIIPSIAPPVSLLTNDVLVALVGFIIVLLLSVIAFFLVRYMKKNDDDWTEIKSSQFELINTVNLLAHRMNENESDLKELKAEVKNLPYVKHQ